MKLEDQVCSLELSKRLKALNVKQESYFYWVNDCGPKGASSTWFVGGGDLQDWIGSEMIAAFTVAELGEMLPESTASFHLLIENTWRWSLELSDGKWICLLMGDDDYICMDAYFVDTNVRHCEQAETEAGARAKVLIHLIEEGLVKP